MIRALKERSIRLTVQAKLNTLDRTTPDAIADVLRLHGAKGASDSAAHCPVANYLRQSMPPGYEVSAASNILVRRAGVANHVGSHKVCLIPTPQTVKDFMRLFDLGAYPDLTAGLWDAIMKYGRSKDS